MNEMVVLDDYAHHVLSHLCSSSFDKNCKILAKRKTFTTTPYYFSLPTIIIIEKLS